MEDYVWKNAKQVNLVKMEVFASKALTFAFVKKTVIVEARVAFATLSKVVLACVSSKPPLTAQKICPATHMAQQVYA